MDYYEYIWEYNHQKIILESLFLDIIIIVRYYYWKLSFIFNFFME